MLKASRRFIVPLRCAWLWPVLLMLVTPPAGQAQNTVFTYQGKLNDMGNPANGAYDFQFKLFDTVVVGSGTQQGADVTRTPVSVSAGVFAAPLDFGSSAFDGADRYLEIGVRPAGSANAYTVLAPRQAVTATPYAIRSATAGNAIQLGGVDAAKYLQSDATGSISVLGDLSVNGTLSLGVINAQTAYNLGGQPVLSNSGTGNVFLGAGAGASNTTGDRNSFLGSDAGGANTVGAGNSFVGESAGLVNTSGSFNSVVGESAGRNNTTGTQNALFGNSAGRGNTTGFYNAFFGANAGYSNAAGSNNSFFGRNAGLNNTASSNAFFGYTAGASNTTGSGNTIIGSEANVGAAGLSNASAFGAKAFVTSSNSLVLGSINGVNGATTDTNVGIGTTAPAHALHVNGTALVGPPGGLYAYSIAGASPGPYPSLGFNSFYNAPTFSYLAGVTGYGGILQFQAGDGKFGYYSTSAATSAGSAQSLLPRFIILNSGRVGIGTVAPQAWLHVNNDNITAMFGTSIAGGGVFGDSQSSIGVRGTSISGDGVFGASDTANGVYGTSVSGYAGYFSGKVHVTGVIEKAGGGFKIDHPQDPENKYLIHSFVESPDMKNLYDGMATTDAKGEAEVTLPVWFMALNRDFRYQLTCIGVFAQAIVLEEIKDNRFKIKTSLPLVKVSWQVTGIRQDAWANQNRLPVEELKPEVERGSYQNPSAFGQPEEKGVEWASYPGLMKQQKDGRERQQNESAAKGVEGSVSR